MTAERGEFDLSKRVFVVGTHRVDPATGEVRGPNGVHRLEPKVLAVLLVLVERRGEVVSKRTLLDTVWSDASVVDDVVWRCIGALRRAFDDDPGAPRVIETLSRRGYRLVAEVRRAGDDPREAAAPTGVHARRRRFRRHVALALFGAFTMLAFLTVGRSTGAFRGNPESAVALAEQPGVPRSPADWGAAEYTRLARESYERRSATDLVRASELFEWAVESDPNHAPAWAGIADARAQLASRFPALGETAGRALEAADRAVALDPELPEAHKARGLALIGLGRIAEATAAYERAIALAPGFATAVGNLAVALGERGQQLEALALYVSLDTRGLPRSIDLHNIGDVLYHLGWFAESRRHLAAALQVDPLQSESIVGLARLDSVEGDLEAARERVDDALAKLPSDRLLRFAAANIATLEGDLQRAGEHLRQALRGSSPGHDVAERVLLAWIERQLGEGHENGDLLRQYAEVLPAAIDAQRSWRLAQIAAAVALLQGDRDAAVGFLEQALAMGHVEWPWLRVDPVFAPLHGDPDFERVLVRGEARWRERAEAIEQALEAGPLS